MKVLEVTFVIKFGVRVLLLNIQHDNYYFCFNVYYNCIYRHTPVIMTCLNLTNDTYLQYPTSFTTQRMSVLLQVKYKMNFLSR